LKNDWNLNACIGELSSIALNLSYYKSKTDEERKIELLQSISEKIKMKLIIEGVQEIDSVTHYRVISWLEDNGYVFRRYNDFKWLYDNILLRFPNLSLPAFPGKTVGKADADIIVQRVNQLEKILLCLLENDETKYCTIMKQFLRGKVLDRKIETQFEVSNENPIQNVKFSANHLNEEDNDDL